jgi:hypothetical protein
MTISIVTIADSIASLSVTGVTIKDLNQIPDSVNDGDCPMVIPNPDGFVSAFELERMAMSSGASNVWDVRYTLTYRFLHSEIGLGMGLLDKYPLMVDKVMDFVDKVLISDSVTGSVDLTLEDISSFGPVSDPSGKMFHGCDIMLRVLEFEP